MNPRPELGPFGAQSNQPSPHRPPRILVVDDDPDSRQMLGAILEEDGFCVIKAGSGREALANMAQGGPDLVLLDAAMPKMDGYEVAAKIRANLASQAVPIILVTGLDSRNARMLGLGAGADDFLAKPVDRLELCVRVRNLLRLSSPDRNDRGRASTDSEEDLRPGEPDDFDEADVAAIVRETTRLMGELSLPWQEAILKVVRGLHEQVLRGR